MPPQAVATTTDESNLGPPPTTDVLSRTDSSSSMMMRAAYRKWSSSNEDYFEDYPLLRMSASVDEDEDDDDSQSEAHIPWKEHLADLLGAGLVFGICQGLGHGVGYVYDPPSPTPYYQVLQDGSVLLDPSLNHPHLENTISNTMLQVIAVGLPILCILVVGGCLQRKVSQVTRMLCALLVGHGLVFLVEHSLKIYVQRPRPNYYALCGFDMESLSCTSQSKTAVHSFPSGHSAESFFAMTLLALYFYGLLSSSTRLPRLVGVLLPLSLAFFVAASRIHDYWHHPSDVLAGSLLGMGGAVAAYDVYYMRNPPLPQELTKPEGRDLVQEVC